MQSSIDEAKNKFSMLSVLLVEDSSFMRLLTSGLLRSFGITQVHTCANGGEAIKWLEDKARTLPPGQIPCDLILTDLYMPEVDGLMFIRWLRGSKKSPDKFMPVIMFSGAVDVENVQKARDAGASEFLAKPFSSIAVWDRFMHAIFKPRKFILSPTYFGPDRRRINIAPPAKERRKTKKEDIQVVHSASKGLNMDKNKIFHFDLPNRLASKFGGSLQDIPTLDPVLLREAEDRIENMAGDYATWVTDHVIKLEKELAALITDDTKIKTHIDNINDLSLELRGQGGIFGYELITSVGKSLYEQTQNKTDSKLLENEWKLLKAHVDTVKLVIQQKIGGDGGSTGKQLLKSLEQAKEKYSS